MIELEAWQTAAIAYDVKGLSWREIARCLNMPKSTVSDFLRKRSRYTYDNIKWEGVTTQGPTISRVLMEGQRIDIHPQEHINQRILFISDMHIPYHNKGLMPFLQGLKDKYKPTRVICLGDELDKHALSYHDSDPDLDSAGPELMKSRPVIAALKEMFPVMDIIDSNHGSLVWRKAKTHGIPRAYIKSYNDVLEVDDGWTWHFDMILDLPDGQQVYVHHGKNASAIKVAQTMGMSHVCGHYHESFGIQYFSTPTKLLWGVNAGCLIDRKSLAFAYSNNNLKRPVLGTCLIIDGKPVLEPMML